VVQRHLSALVRPMLEDVLNAIRAPPALRDLGEHHAALPEKLLNNPVRGAIHEILEGMLHNERGGLVAHERCPLALQQ